MSAAAGRGGPQLIPRPVDARPGDAPRWVAHVGTRPELGADDVRRAFASHPVERSMGLVAPGLRRSAVAALLAWSGPEPEVLLTRRAWTMRTHRGEVSFAGGAEDPGDDFPVGTALREATEEVALDASLVEVVGALDPLTTFTSDRVVVPVVLVTPERPQVIRSPVEVDDILHVPLAELLDPDCYHQEVWSWEAEAGIPARTEHRMHFFDLPGDTVWGATAAMLDQLLSVLFRVA